jgi:vacuolar-type H+-ATPase subunit E/Vma4
MGREELAIALQQKGEAQVKAIRQQAEDEAERYRLQCQREVESQAHRCDREADQSAQQECQQVDWLVAKKVRNLRLLALQELGHRLWQLALTELDRLDPQVRRQCLDQLAAELPIDNWHRVTVHPDDAPAAKKLFPGRVIETDVAIGGGLTVSTETGDICIDNSLLRRLGKLWPELSGRILAELEESLD